MTRLVYFSLQQYQNQLFQQTDDVDGKTEIIIKVSGGCLIFYEESCVVWLVPLKMQSFLSLLQKQSILYLALPSGRGLSFP